MLQGGWEMRVPGWYHEYESLKSTYGTGRAGSGESNQSKRPGQEEEIREGGRKR